MGLDKDIKDIKILFTEEEIQKRVKELAAEIEAVFPENETLYAVCVLRGSVIFFSDILRCINRTVQMEFIKVSSCGNETKSGGGLKILDINLPDLKNKNILIIEDIIDSGVTAKYLKEMFMNKYAPKKLFFAALLNKKCARQISIEPDFYGFETGDKFVIGYGMDYKGYFRNLPYIGYFPAGV